MSGGGGSQYRIGNGNWSSSAGTLSPGETVRVRHTTAATPGTATTTTLTIGGVIGTFTTTTLVPDTTPDAFSFPPQTGVDPSTLVTSNTVTISGITGDTAISVSGAAGSEYRVGNSNWTSSAGTLSPGETVRVRHVTAATPGTATTTTLIIGGVTGTFTTTTFNPDTTPDAFGFAAQTGVAPGTVVMSDPVTVSGFDTNTAISISGTASSEYRIGNGNWSSAAGTITDRQTVRVRHTSASAFGTTTTTTLTIGGVSGTFSVHPAP